MTRAIDCYCDFVSPYSCLAITQLPALARSLGPKGIHVAYLAIDAVIDVPWARQMSRDKPDEFFARPSAIADVAFGLAHQDRSTWAFDVVVRPFAEPW